MSSPLLLCILDGFGLNPRSEGNAIALADTPNFDRLWEKYPSTTLVTFGERVGLPDDQMGNSEVGHLNIGAGRVVEQSLLRIDRALESNFLQESSEYNSLISNLQQDSTLHLIGLFSNGGVHSQSRHLLKLLERIPRDFSGEIRLHLFTDGRDSAPHAAKNALAELMSKVSSIPKCKIATVTGRFYAMDRDNRWERTHKAYLAIAEAKAERKDPLLALDELTSTGQSDEFLEPIVVTPSPIGKTDGVIFWNFREDRARQLVAALCLSEASGFTHFNREAPLFSRSRTLCFTEYDSKFDLPVLFQPVPVKNHLGETVSMNGFNQLRVAETEKYPHVTYFFNGGEETPFKGEDRKLIPSPRDVKTYDLKPEMSAHGVTAAVVEGLRSGKYGLIVVNLANCDMVGHTGVLAAAIKAVEKVDSCLGEMISVVLEVGGEALILADHGNAEQMIDYEHGTPHTAHTKYPVPLILVTNKNPQLTLKDNGALCDIAPTALNLMDIPIPAEMTGITLLTTS